MFHLGECKTLVETENQIVGPVVAIPDSCDADTTAQWIKRVLQGKIAVPINIRHQVEHCLRVAKELKSVA